MDRARDNELLFKGPESIHFPDALCDSYSAHMKLQTMNRGRTVAVSQYNVLLLLLYIDKLQLNFTWGL